MRRSSALAAWYWVVPSPTAALPLEAEGDAEWSGLPLHGLAGFLQDCERCKLSRGRTQVVFGVGDHDFLARGAQRARAALEDAEVEVTWRSFAEVGQQVKAGGSELSRPLAESENWN